jgi:Fur family transcriptional regulator, ferric uptake regulator
MSDNDAGQPGAIDRLDDLEITITEPLCAVFRRRLREDGQKYTPERAQILDTIIQIDDVFEADRLQEELRQADFRVSKATIYRTLKLLQETGIIQQAPIESEQATYMLAYGKKPQHLLIRVDTNHVESIEAQGLSEIVEELCAQRGLSVQGYRLQVYAKGK